MPPSCALLGGFQSVHRLHCYGNITQTRNVSEYTLVLAVCLVFYLFVVVLTCLLVKRLKPGVVEMVIVVIMMTTVTV